MRVRGLLLIAAIVGVSAVVAARAWVATAGPRCQSWTDVDLGAVDVHLDCVRVEATAHYPLVVRQTVPARLGSPERHQFLFPLFANGDNSDRAIRFWLRTEREPDALVSYERMLVEGRVGLVTHDDLPLGTEVAFGKRTDYWFTDDMIWIEPDRVTVDGELWTRPE